MSKEIKSFVDDYEDLGMEYGYYLTIAETFVKDKNYNKIKFQNVLDLGCNRGFIVKAFRDMEIDAYGCDISYQAISKSPPEIRNYLLLVDIAKDKLPFEEGTFDLITMLDVVEHLPQFELLLSELKRVLRSGGLIYISTPSTITSLNCDDPTHINVHSKKYWIKLLTEHGFDLIGEFPKEQRNKALSFLKKSQFEKIISKIYYIPLVPNLRSDLIFQK